MVTVKNIDTELWNRAIEKLTKDNWIITYRYDNFDAGIDFDSVTLKKRGEEIFCEWTNWFEGEIKCSTMNRLHEIEKLIGHKFKNVE